MLVAIILLLSSGSTTIGESQTILPLNGHHWTFRGQRTVGSNVTKISGKAMVPGEIYTDLYAEKLIPDPLYANNNEQLQWVGLQNWTYETLFQLSNEQLKHKDIILRAEGLDTVATVYMNGKFVSANDNQFRPVIQSVKDHLTIGKNNLTIQFISPVQYAKTQSDKFKERYGHIVPPECPVGIQRGQCHVNFIRKAQSSFSWDWGPSFPTLGIWKDISLQFVDHCSFRRITAVPIINEKGDWNVHLDLFAYCALEGAKVLATVRIPELDWKVTWSATTVNDVVNRFSTKAVIPARGVELWWPNGYGDQKLYKAEASLTFNTEAAHPVIVQSEHIIEVGFRTVIINQSFVVPNMKEKGRNFYVQINGVPIFMKGSNWIPASPFLTTVTDDRLEFYFESMVAANMNSIRVWGGGAYESDYFYHLADKHGIMIWQDMVFACALYPADYTFLANVKAEVAEQVDRLKSHPSVIIFAGNNENEIAIRGEWWDDPGVTDNQVIASYMKLYNHTIRPVVEERAYGSRPYLLSSPSNGIESEQEGGVARHPGDEKYGDIHFYDYTSDAWKVTTFKTPRCASEYGYQSLPNVETLKNSIGVENWNYFSRPMIHRQHHMGGQLEILFMVFSHFGFPKCIVEVGDNNMSRAPTKLNMIAESLLHFFNGSKDDNSMTEKAGEFLNAMIYLTQMHQGIAYQAQTEHYRRWKASHYFAKRFFAPVIVSLWLDGDNLQAAIVSDLTVPLEHAKLIFNMLSWTNGFSPVYSVTIPVEVGKLSSVWINLQNNTQKNAPELGPSDFVFSARLVADNLPDENFEAVLLPNRLFDSNPMQFGKPVIDSISLDADGNGVITIKSDAVAPLVWLEIDTVRGWFSDNAFTMTQHKKTVKFYPWKRKVTVSDLKKDLTLKSLRYFYE